MEMLYHVDEHDQVLGAISREHAHRDKVLHRAGCVVVFDEAGHVYVARRAHTKTLFAGCMDSVCSFHVGFGETYEDAAKRELYEETGIHANPSMVRTYHVDDPLDPMIVALFVLEYSGDVTLDPLEASIYECMTLKQVDWVMQHEPVTPWLMGVWPDVRAYIISVKNLG